MHQVANKHSSFTTGHTLYTTVTVSTVIFDSLTRFVTSQSLANLRLITAISIEKSMLTLEKVRHLKHIPINQN